MSLVLGIDCGVTGALAVVVDGRLVEAIDMPTTGGVVDANLVDLIIRDTAGFHLAVVERLHAMPSPVGSKANFSKGLSYGIVLGVLASHGIPVEKPTPAVWKREMGVTKDKDTARAMALNLWPEQVELFRRKKDADRAEAALMAEWGRRLLATRGQTQPRQEIA